MKGKKVIAGILLAGILAVTLAGCKNTDNTKDETEKPVITLGSDSYPPYNYLNEDGVPTGIDVELATEAFKRMGYQVNIINLRLDITHLYYPAKNSFQKGRLKRREIFTELLLYTLTT